MVLKMYLSMFWWRSLSSPTPRSKSQFLIPKFQFNWAWAQINSHWTSRLDLIDSKSSFCLISYDFFPFCYQALVQFLANRIMISLHLLFSHLISCLSEWRFWIKIYFEISLYLFIVWCWLLWIIYFSFDHQIEKLTIHPVKKCLQC